MATISQTKAPKKDQIKGSSKNKVGSASSKKSSASINFSESVTNTLKNKMDDYNKKHPNSKVSLGTLKAVFRRGAGAFSSSHRPGMSRSGWAFARVNKFLLKKGGTKVKAAYVQDDDLMKKGGELQSTFEKGGLIAPNGAKSNLTPEQYKLVRTPEFKAWFGDWENDPENASKVVDENGEPLVVYHGTTKFFNVFKISDKFREDWGVRDYGVYFSDDKKTAEMYSLDFTKKEEEYNKYEKELQNLAKNGKFDDYKKLNIEFNKKYPISDLSKRFYKVRLLECFLNIKNPFKIDGKGLNWFNILNGVVDKALNNNYNGIIVKNIIEVNDIISTTYLAFEPTQIKLADGTNDTFDGENPDIRYEQGGNVGQDITCIRCKWQWNTKDSDESDKYVCHNCGFDNRTYYDADPMGKFKDGGMLKRPHSINLIAIKHSTKIEDVIKALEEGTKIEKEHTKNDSVAKTIAQHHLWESIDYYKKLEEMEKSFELGGEQEEYSHKDYIDNEREEISEVLNADDLRISKFLICKAKYELAQNKENTTLDEEDANLWNYVKILWLDAMRKVSDKKYEHGGNVENKKSLHQIYTYEKGGLAYGNSHAKGGIPLLNKGTNSKIEIEGGEGVINKRSMQMNDKMEFEGEKLTPCQIISKINQKGGGVKFKCSDVVDIIKNDGKYK
jgi:hypothetical protein